MTFLLNGKPVDALALIVHRSAQETIGRQWVKKLREPTIHFDDVDVDVLLTDV